MKVAAIVAGTAGAVLALDNQLYLAVMCGLVLVVALAGLAVERAIRAHKR